MISKYSPGPVNLSSVLKLAAKRMSSMHMDFLISPMEERFKTIFVVGCGHSGTSLVSAKIGGLPEAFLIGHESGIFLPKHSLEASREALSQMIYFAKFNNRSVLIEKTPKHVHCIRRILKVKPDALILGVVRNPLDNCASLYKRFGSLDLAIRRWNQDNHALFHYRTISSVKIVAYEELTKDPVKVFREIALWAGLKWSDNCLVSSTSAYDSGSSIINQKDAKNLILRAKQVNSPISSRFGAWKSVFSEAQKNKVLVGTENIFGLTQEYSDVPLPI